MEESHLSQPILLQEFEVFEKKSLPLVYIRSVEIMPIRQDCLDFPVPSQLLHAFVNVHTLYASSMRSPPATEGSSQAL